MMGSWFWEVLYTFYESSGFHAQAIVVCKFSIIISTLLEKLKSLFTVKYSEEGHNRREAELQAWVHFCDFLDECEGNVLILCL